ncbi:shikimate kinase [Pelagibacterales bacterium SAG-MED20]|nr:shikimate kinase [Pelagibacterales bacterium SAG-MED20]
MNLKKNLVFLGMMGSGKSSIGKLVSKKLNIKFIDIDNIIEDMMNMSISNIFKEKGEDYFRNLEEKVTLKNLKMNDTVIALGGGSFINEKIRKEILTNHLSFWLFWDDTILIKRIKGSKKRPLAVKSKDHEIKQLIKKRSKIYQKARFKINCNKLTKTEIVKNIINIYESN